MKTEALNKIIRFVRNQHGGQMYGEAHYTKHLEDVVVNMEDAMLNKSALFRSAKSWLMKHGEITTKTSQIEVENFFIACGWSHDVVEDTDAGDVHLIDLGGEAFAYVVDCVTKREGEAYHDYIKRVKSNPVSLFLKVTDTQANLNCSILDGNAKRIRKYSLQLGILVREL